MFKPFAIINIRIQVFAGAKGEKTASHSPRFSPPEI